MDRRPLRWKYNQMTTPLTIEYVDSAHEARRWRDQGYCPIECAFGEESVVDALQMDHHGTMGDLEGVAVRACRDHYGPRKADPPFVVAGAADADAHLTRKVNAFAGVCISVYLHCNSRNCSQPAKKFRGFPFFQLPISINSDLFRISDFGFRISGSAGLRKRSPVQRRSSPFACQSPLRSRADADAGVGFRIQGQRACRTEEVAGGGRYLFLLGLIHAAQAPA